MRHTYTLFKRYKDSKNKKSVVWFFYYYDEDGNRKAKSTGMGTKHEAEVIAEKVLVEAHPRRARMRNIPRLLCKA